VVVGCCLLAVGTLGDARGWWGDAPFLTNVLSSMAGAMFGIPIALLVLPLLADDLTQHAERRAVINLTTAIVESLSTTLSSLLGANPELQLDRLVHCIDEAEKKMVEPLSEFIDLWPRVFIKGHDPVLWAALAGDWDGLKSLGTRLRECACPWLDPQAVYALTDALNYLFSGTPPCANPRFSNSLR
jgi:hypothetical protein